MGERLDQFKEFVKGHPKLKFEVRDGKRSWQSIFDEWVLLGSDDSSWSQYIDDKENALASVQNQEFMRSALGYLQKINPDSINKTLGTVQKVLQIVQGISPSKSNRINYSPREQQPDPLFRRFGRYDD